MTEHLPLWLRIAVAAVRQFDLSTASAEEGTVREAHILNQLAGLPGFAFDAFD